jgi:ATP-dependent Clp protease adaptor protein ClpS
MVGGNPLPRSSMEIIMTVQEDIVLDEKIQHEVKKPKKYNVIFVNDEVTPMDWVIGILVEIFKYKNDAAHEITMKIHTQGSAVVGTYNFEIAEQKTSETVTLSRNQGYPLVARVEEN